MLKKKAIFFIFAAGLLMFAGQILLLCFIEKPAIMRFKPISHLLNITGSIPLPMILMDRRILLKLKDACPFCNIVYPVAFATFYKRLHEVQRVQSVLDAAGFSSSLMLNTLPLEPAAPRAVRDLPTCLLISKDGVAVQLVFLHDRAEGYWWYGAAQSDFGIDKKLIDHGIKGGVSDMDIMKHEGALERFEGRIIELQGISFIIPKNIESYLLQRTKDTFLECSHSRAAAHREEYGVDESNDAIKFKHKAWKILTKAKQVLDKLEVPFWLSSGTCLGYYRECELITYSKDIDLGIMASDYTASMIPLFVDRGFKLKHIFGWPNDSFEISFTHNDLKLDIFFFYKEGKTMWNGGTQAKSGLKFKYSFPAFTLCWTEFLNLKVLIPCQTLSYILANYGSEWSAPQRSWDWKSSPPNVRPNGQWKKKDWPQVIQVY